MSDFAEVRDQVLAKVVTDPAFRQQFIADPKAVLASYGLTLPEGLAVKVVENTANTLYLALPPRAEEGELSDDQLDNVAGGFSVWTGGSNGVPYGETGGTGDHFCF